MIFLTSSILGMVACSFRSALIVVMTVWLLVFAGVASAIISMQVPTMAQVGLAVLGYNLGIIVSIIAALVPVRRSTAKNA